MRLKTTLHGVCVSTIGIPSDVIFTDPPRRYETVITSDCDDVTIPGGEMVLGYYFAEYMARLGHYRAVAWVRVHQGRVAGARPFQLEPR